MVAHGSLKRSTNTYFVISCVSVFQNIILWLSGALYCSKSERVTGMVGPAFRSEWFFSFVNFVLAIIGLSGLLLLFWGIVLPSDLVYAKGIH